jgi:hypothetical protein
MLPFISDESDGVPFTRAVSRAPHGQTGEGSSLSHSLNDSGDKRVKAHCFPASVRPFHGQPTSAEAQR